MLTDDDKAWIAEKLGGVERRMLDAFRNFAHPIDARIRAQKAATTLALGERLDLLEDRVEFLEEGSGKDEKPPRA